MATTHYGICHGPIDALRRLRIDEKTAYANAGEFVTFLWALADWMVGAGAPSGTPALETFYFRTDNSTVYRYIVSVDGGRDPFTYEEWVLQYAISDRSDWHQGDGDPSESIGIGNSFYFDDSNEVVWIKDNRKQEFGIDDGVTAPSTVTLEDFTFRGGFDKLGGISGRIFWQVGDYEQVVMPIVAERYGDLASEVPAYRGIATAMFTGLEPEDSFRGFYWGANQPFIPSVDFMVERVPRGWYETKAKIAPVSDEPIVDEVVANSKATTLRHTFTLGPDVNPAHIIRECLTNSVWGIGLPETAVDDVSFRAAADTFYDESFGLSFLWLRESKMQDFVQEVLDHCETVLYVSPSTGLFVLKPLRGDYDSALLREFDETNSTVSSLNRILPSDLANEIVVSFTNPGERKKKNP